MAGDIARYVQRLPARLRDLVRVLGDIGYQFTRPDEILPGPSPRVGAEIQELERLVGPVPLALAEFYRVVGSIDLTGAHLDWSGCDYPDPLTVGAVSAVLEEAQEYVALPSREQYWGPHSGVFRAPVAPDFYHKANVSGGMWYSIEIPNSAEDPVLLEERNRLPFTRYLEFALSWGGFPGLASAPNHTWPVAELRRAVGAA
jgi:hypothetical protein